MAHPVAWNRSVGVAAVATGELQVVSAGAIVAGATADALVVHDRDEQRRRDAAGLTAVTRLDVLDAVMNLPWALPMRLADLSSHTRAALNGLADGVVEVDGGWVTRWLTPPLTVVAAAVRDVGWRRPLQRVGRYAPFAQRLVVLPRLPRDRVLWEAQVAGVGVWVYDGDAMVELCPAVPFVRQYWKPAGWRFAERAYAASLRATPPKESSTASEGRPARTVHGGLRPLPRPLPST